MVDMYKQVSDATAFVRGDGSKLHSLKSLEMALLTMHESEFSHHVGSGKNDFANWVQHVFGYNELANKLRNTSGRIDMLAVLDEATRVKSAKAPANIPSPTHTVTSSAVDSKKLHQKLHGIFHKGETPVRVPSPHMSMSTPSASVPKTSNHYSLASHIDHLDKELSHMTRHHAHSFSRDNAGSAITEATVKERIIDFALGLIVGLMLGFVLAKSMGV